MVVDLNEKRNPNRPKKVDFLEWVRHLLQHVSGVYDANDKFLLWAENCHTRTYNCQKVVRVNVELRNNACSRSWSQPSRRSRPLLAWEDE